MNTFIVDSQAESRVRSSVGKDKVKVKNKLSIGMIFPGQGSQHLGMCKELYDEERSIQERFEEASLCLDMNFIRACFASSEKELRDIMVSQTSIFLVSASIFSLLKNKYGIEPDLVAGHSLGEYSAIYAAGGMSFVDGLYLLKKRAQIMKENMDRQNGGMLAVLAFPYEQLRFICDQYNQPENNISVAEVVNYNSPTQYVVSGTIPELEEVKRDVEILRGKAIMLPVSGSFHSRLTRMAEQQFSPYLFKADFKKLRVPLVNNMMAQKVSSPAELRLSIVRQTSSHVLWWQSMQHFRDMDIIIEIGPNDKFAKMLKREWPEKTIVSVNNQEDIDNLQRIIKEKEANLVSCAKKTEDEFTT
ncbi:ACP S-malonyltransferase [bacterium]|nr:ACP S-malonyltransferase [bacterium]